MDTCNLLYKVLESAKGLIGFSSFPLLHLLFGNICHFQKEPALWINQIIQLFWHQNNRKVKFPYLEQVRNFSSRSLSKIFDFSSSSMSSSARVNKTRCSDKYQQWRCMLASRACSSVMTDDLEGRLDGRQVIWGGFGNHVREPCLQHNLLFLIYDFGDILSHPQCKNLLSISHESVKRIFSLCTFISNIKLPGLKQSAHKAFYSHPRGCFPGQGPFPNCRALLAYWLHTRVIKPGEFSR